MRALSFEIHGSTTSTDPNVVKSPLCERDLDDIGRNDRRRQVTLIMSTTS